MAFINFVKAVQEEIFKRIQEDTPRSEEQYDDIDIDGIIHEEIDYSLTHEYDGDIEECIVNYGIQKALDLYIDSFGAIEKASIRSLLHEPVRDGLNICWNEYSLWAFKDEDECGCGVFPEEPIKCHMCGEIICEECYKADDNTFKLINKEHKVYGCGNCDDLISGRREMFEGDVFARGAWDAYYNSEVPA